jgi:hypothetical protein
MKMYLTSNSLRQWVRIFVPIAFGNLIAVLSKKIDPHIVKTLSSIFTQGGGYASIGLAFGGLYAAVLLWLEKRYRWASAFLGALPQPNPAKMPVLVPATTWVAPVETVASADTGAVPADAAAVNTPAPDPAAVGPVA